MNLRVLVRAASLIAVALVAWSLNVRWGSSSSVRGGPPIQWERTVVGAALLAAIAALAIWLATRPKIGASRIWLRGIAGGAALAVAAIAIRLRSEAVDRDLNDLMNGPGWSWLTAGAAVAIAASAASFALRGEPDRAPRSAKRRAR